MRCETLSFSFCQDNRQKNLLDHWRWHFLQRNIVRITRSTRVSSDPYCVFHSVVVCPSPSNSPLYCSPSSQWSQQSPGHSRCWGRCRHSRHWGRWWLWATWCSGGWRAPRHDTWENNNSNVCIFFVIEGDIITNIIIQL